MYNILDHIDADTIFSGGNRIDSDAAAVATGGGIYLGKSTTVTDAEMLGVATGWKQSCGIEAAIGCRMRLQ